jgi:NTP pyrophosphatase (non-canonical NTP hydrolase)
LLAQDSTALPPRPATAAFQRYYSRIAAQRGYDRETLKDCVILLLEEVGELARAVRKAEGMVRHGVEEQNSCAEEIADVFLYAMHIANALSIDLGAIDIRKELSNRLRFEQAMQKRRTLAPA